MTADPAKVFFLLEERELKAFLEQIGRNDVNIILKPITRPTLEAFLADFIGGSRPSLPEMTDTAESLRGDRDQILQCLIQTNLRLQQIEQGRNNFLARTIHDFRTPLTALEGYCGLLVSGMLGDFSDSQREVIQRMQQSAQRLSRMASGLFQLTTGRHVNIEPRYEQSDISESVDQAAHEIAPYLQEKHIELLLNLQPSPDDFCFDRPQIERLLVNLLDNACKYTPTYGRISVHGFCAYSDRLISAHCSSAPNLTGYADEDTATPNSYRIEVQDTGPGIPPEILGHIFEEYATYSHGADRSGGGLGLAISKMIVERHKGAIWAENASSGARFVCVLPLRLARAEASNTEEMGVLVGRI
jgi:signal transduction histidine kinase